MRPVTINYKDYTMFGDEIGPTAYSFFNKNRQPFDRMMDSQGRLFWRRYLVSFKAHCIENKLFENPFGKGDFYRHVILEGFNYIEMQVMNWSKAATRTKAFIDDMAKLLTCKHFIYSMDSKKIAKDPFCIKGSREVYRKVFAEDGLSSLARIRAWVFCNIYLKFAGTLCITLRRWMDASEISGNPQKQHDYWHPPPCDMFLYFTFSDEVYKLLPNQVDPDIPSIDREEIRMKDREKFGKELKQYKPKPPKKEDADSLTLEEKRKGKRMVSLNKPGICISLEVITAPYDRSKLSITQDYGVVSYRAYEHRHIPITEYRKIKEEINEGKAEDTLSSVLDLLTKEERKRFTIGILAENDRRKGLKNPKPEPPNLHSMLEYTPPKVPAVHTCQDHKDTKKPYIFKRCSHCNKVECDMKTFKVCKICHDRKALRCRWYCSKTCQIVDWRRHRQEHMHIERVRMTIEDDQPDYWVIEYDHILADDFTVEPSDRYFQVDLSLLHRACDVSATKDP